MNAPRLLKEDEISCRAQHVTDGGIAMVLLYKDARVDMNILDETYGPMNWQRTHEVINEGLFCNISIWDNDKRAWVTKQDVGVESKTEATKGEASDAFKRSGTNWGIGRELYTAPDIFINLEKDEWKVGLNGKPQTTFKFGLSVGHIDYNDKREISSLTLIDKSGKTRFTYGNKAPARPPVAPDAPKEPTPPAPKAKPKPKPRQERIVNLCNYHNIDRARFNTLVFEVQDENKMSRTDAELLDDTAFGTILSLVHTKLQTKS